jgi:mannan endo-1,4-beta-mannosidase
VTQPERQPAARRAGHRRAPGPRKRLGPMTWGAIVIGVVAVVVTLSILLSPLLRASGRPGPQPAHAQSVRYLGVYERHVLSSYASVDQFAQAIGRQPNLVSYYSSWLEPFQASFAMTAARHGAAPLVQINPVGVSLTAIASGQYDDYLTTYAAAVRSYRRPVVLSFGHEMNGPWYAWGHGRTSPAVFVAAWRHIVSVFRMHGASNVIWLWTINVINARHNRIPAPAPWWPGSSYVTWVGIDGYYHQASWKFAPLFGPTIAAVRSLTRDPILIAETGAAPSANQPAKIADLFAGVRTYGLLGFLWFNSVGNRDWRLDSPAALAAFRRGVKA